MFTSFRDFLKSKLDEMSLGQGDYKELTAFIAKEKEGDYDFITKKLKREEFHTFKFDGLNILVTNKDELFYIYVKEKDIYYPVYFFGMNIVNVSTLQVGRVAKHPSLGNKAPKGLLEQCYIELSKYFSLWSDDTQYNGARKLWCRLTKLTNVDFYNYEENKVIEKNVKIDNPDDPKYWGEDVWDCVLRIKKHK